MKLLRNRNYVAVSCTACVGTIIYFSMNVLWPIQIASLSFATGNIGIGWLSVCAKSIPYPYFSLKLTYRVYNRSRCRFWSGPCWHRVQADWICQISTSGVLHWHDSLHRRARRRKPVSQESCYRFHCLGRYMRGLFRAHYHHNGRFSL